jgi:hypothetical protein
MFTFGAFALTILVAWYADRKNKADRPQYDDLPKDDAEQALLLHARQDLKLIAFLLAAILIALGVVADRI